MLLTLLSSLALAAPTWTDVASSTAWTEFKVASTRNVGEVRLSSATIGGTGCFRGVATVADLPADTLLAVVTDIESAPRWSSAGVREAVVLERTGDRIDYYQYLSVPIVSDRFWFVSGQIVREPDRVGLRWERVWDRGGPHGTAFEALVAANPRAIELPVNVGGWLFRTVPAGVEISYQICSDSGGAIPENVQSMATRSSLPTHLDDLVKEARRR